MYGRGEEMANVEKVTKGLKCYADETACKSDCPYYTFTGACFAEIARQTLRLLTEQQETIERLERELANTQNNLNFYLNGNE